jgi:hypothetical protein
VASGSRRSTVRERAVRHAPRVSDRAVSHHLRLADLNAHKHQLTSRGGIITHMSAEVLADDQATSFERARDGLIVGL